MRRAGIDEGHASHANGHGRKVKGGVHLRRRRLDRASIETTGSLKLFGVPRDATATGARITSKPGTYVSAKELRLVQVKDVVFSSVESVRAMYEYAIAVFHSRRSKISRSLRASSQFYARAAAFHHCGAENVPHIHLCIPGIANT